MINQEHVQEAVRVAQISMINFAGLLGASGVSLAELQHLLTPGWPPGVLEAYTTLLSDLRTLAILNVGGINVWGGLPMEKREEHLRTAHEQLMESPLPDVPHASGVAPIIYGERDDVRSP